MDFHRGLTTMIMFKAGNRQYNREKLSILREIIIHGYKAMEKHCPSRIDDTTTCTTCKYYTICTDIANLLQYINEELYRTYH